MPAQQVNVLDQIATNAVRIIDGVAAGLMEKGWPREAAQTAATTWYTDWSAYLQAVVAANVTAAGAVVDALIGAGGK